MLDDKLKEILEEAVYDSDYESVPRMIAKIKKAFAEEPSLRSIPMEGDSIMINGVTYMTGQEWYSEFVHELKAFYTDLDIPQQEAALEAAKKASGQ